MEENKEVKQEVKKQKYSVVFSTDENGESKHKFRPAVTIEHFKHHYKNIMDNFVAAYLEMFNNVSILRPATTEEKDKHIYVFKTDDKEDTEHKLYEARKMLYEDTLKAFNYILSMVFPDIQYIEHCNLYQQELAFDKDRSQDEIEDYKYDVEYITQQIRENYDDLIKMLNAGLAEEMAKQNEETAEPVKEETKEV